MPNWKEIQGEIEEEGKKPHSSPADVIRQKYLKKVFEYTGRNVIAYYSGWLTKPPAQGISIGDEDKNAFMSTVHQLDKSLGLDLILHTPGGDIAATESIVKYLRSIFGVNVRAIIPQIAMSAGTMIACSCKEIIMGKQSNLGPIDPQYNGVPALAVIDEFKKAIDQVKNEPAAIPIWQTIIGKYHPTFIGECERAVKWSQEIVKEWIETGMFRGEAEANERSLAIVRQLSDHNETRTHSRHIHLDDCLDMGLKILKLEDDQKLQDLVLSVHHSFMHTFSKTSAIKIVENHIGNAYVLMTNAP